MTTSYSLSKEVDKLFPLVKMGKKLFLVTRADLPPGQQAVQAAHALAEFMIRHATESQRWHSGSNTLVMLAVPNEKALVKLFEKALPISKRVFPFKDPLCSIFHEPDRNNEATAIALAPLLQFERLCQKLPLALADARAIREVCGVTEIDRSFGFRCTSPRCPRCQKISEHP